MTITCLGCGFLLSTSAFASFCYFLYNPMQEKIVYYNNVSKNMGSYSQIPHFKKMLEFLNEQIHHLLFLFRQ